MPGYATPDAVQLYWNFPQTEKWNGREKVKKTERREQTRIQNKLAVNIRLNHFLTLLIKNKFYIVNYINRVLGSVFLQRFLCVCLFYYYKNVLP